MLPVMVKEISDPMERHRGFSASGSTLDYKNLITGVADDSVLFLLDRADDIFQLDLTVTAELCFQDFIIDLGVAFKSVDQFPRRILYCHLAVISPESSPMGA